MDRSRDAYAARRVNICAVANESGVEGDERIFFNIRMPSQHIAELVLIVGNRLSQTLHSQSARKLAGP